MDMPVNKFGGDMPVIRSVESFMDNKDIMSQKLLEVGPVNEEKRLLSQQIGGGSIKLTSYHDSLHAPEALQPTTNHEIYVKKQIK